MGLGFGFVRDLVGWLRRVIWFILLLVFARDGHLADR